MGVIWIWKELANAGLSGNGMERRSDDGRIAFGLTWRY